MNVLWFVVLFIFVMVFIWLHHLWRTRRVRRITASLKGPLVVPFFGNTLEFLGSNIDILAVITNLPKRYPPPFRLWLGNTLYVIISNPVDVQTLCNSKFQKKSADYDTLIPILRNGIFTSSGPVWKNHRKLIMPTFNKKVLDSFVVVFAEQAEVLVEILKAEIGNGAFDAFKYTNPCTLASICETTMGVKVNAQLENSPFLYWVNSALEIAYKKMVHIWLKIDLLFRVTPYAKREKEVVEKTQNFVENIIKKKKEEYCKRQENEDIMQQIQEDPKRNSALDLMIQLSSNGNGFTDEELRDEVTTIIAAGSDTTAQAIGYSLVMLAMYPQYQEKVYREIIDVLGPNRTLEHTDLKHFIYTEMVLKETLRIYPPSPVLGRIAEEDIHLESCTIPANSSFLIHLLEMHRDPKIYPDPMKFDPDRFLPEEVAKRHPYSWIPFVAGPRNCIGLNYAMMQMKAIMVYLIRRYKFKTPYKSVEEIELRVDLLIKPVHGHLVSIEPRE